MGLHHQEDMNKEDFLGLVFPWPQGEQRMEDCEKMEKGGKQCSSAKMGGALGLAPTRSSFGSLH